MIRKNVQLFSEEIMGNQKRTVIAGRAGQSVGLDSTLTHRPHAAMTATQNASCETTRTFSLGSIFCTPSATIFAPSATPLEITTSLLS
jgi:hypothetical protein